MTQTIFPTPVQPVSDNATTLSVDDGAGSLTVDGTVAVTQATASNLNAQVVGDVAHDGGDSGNPVKIGGKASSTAPAAVSDNDRTNAWFDLFGRQTVSDLDPEIGVAKGMLPLRDQQTAQRYTVLADSVADGLASFWTTNHANGGSATVTGGEGLLKTSVATNGQAQLSSTTPAYHPGQVAWFNSAIRVGDTGTAGDIRRWGAFTVSGTTPQDGFYYELSGTTLNAVVAKAGTPTAVASTSWSRVTPAPFSIDTNYHQFQIWWTANSVWFIVDNVVRHVVTGTTTPITATLNFPMTLTNVKTSGASDITLAVRNIGIGRFGQPESMTSAGPLSIAKAEDVASADADVGVPAMAVRKATPANTSGTDGDYEMLQMSAGRLWTSTTVETLPNVTLAAGTNTNEVVGDAAHDAGIAGNPVRIGGRALTSDYTAVSAGDTADLITTLLGKLVTIPFANPNQSWSYAAASGGITNTTGVTAKAAAGAGVRNYVTHVSVINGHATVDTDVQIRDGASGTVLWRGFAKAGGGGCAEDFNPPLRGTANTLVEVACGTTGTATYFNLQGFVAAE